MENQEPSKQNFYIPIFKTMFRLGACYGLWIWGADAGEPVIQAVGVFFGIAEVIGIAEKI
jgi:hypothetical protein